MSEAGLSGSRSQLVYRPHGRCSNCGSGWQRVWPDRRRQCGSCGRKLVQISREKGYRGGCSRLEATISPEVRVRVGSEKKNGQKTKVYQSVPPDYAEEGNSDALEKTANDRKRPQKTGPLEAQSYRFSPKAAAGVRENGVR